MDIEKPFVRGDKLKTITTLNKFKGVMNELVLGYPAYISWGIFEAYFHENTNAVIKILEEDNIIKTFQPQQTGGPISYIVTSNGIMFANAMAQLEYSHKTHGFNKKLKLFTQVLTIATVGMLIFSFAQSLIVLWQ